MAVLIGFFADQRFRVDSAIVDENGTAHFKRDQPYQPGMLYLVYNDNTSIQMLIDSDQTFTMKTRRVSVVNSMEVEGSIDNELLYRTLKFENLQRGQLSAVATKLSSATRGTPEYDTYKAEQDELVRQRTEFLQAIYDEHPDALFTKFKIAGKNPEIGEVLKADGVTMDTSRHVYLFRTQFWDGVDFSDERLLYTPVIGNKLKRYITELTPQNPDSISSAARFLIDKVLDHPEYFKLFTNWIVLNYEPTKTTLMDPEAVYVTVVENYFTEERAFWASPAEVQGLRTRASEMTASLVGKKALDVTANDPNGNPQTLYDIKSPYIVVFLFNPTCDNCMIETPKLVNFYRQWKSKGVEVFAIAIDTNDAEWKAYVKKNGMNWINVFDPTNKSIYGKFYVDHTPEIYVLNPDRTIIAKNLKTEQIQSVIERDQRKRAGK